jgi:hypothetical protein
MEISITVNALLSPIRDIKTSQKVLCTEPLQRETRIYASAP